MYTVVRLNVPNFISIGLSETKLGYGREGSMGVYVEIFPKILTKMLDVRRDVLYTERSCRD